ncbi:MAG: OmpA family protein [Myxococcota bacterium]|nr:OmpA family protein [Myxococcota bacterium]
MLSLIFGLFVATSSAQDADGTLDISYFRPPPDGYRYYSVPSATTLRHLQMGVSFWVSYENDPLIFTAAGKRVAPDVVDVDGDLGDAVIDNRVTSNVQMSLGFFQFLSISVDLPLIFWQSGYQLNALMYDEDPDYLIPSGIGDLRFAGKAVLLDRDKLPVGLAFYLPVGTPTGSGGSLFGEESFTYTPTGILEFSDNKIRDRSYKIRGSVFGGYHIRASDRLLTTDIGNQFVYGLGLAYHPVGFIEFLMEYNGRTGQEGTTAELLGGVKLLGGNAVEINLGGGFGILPGIGTTDMRGIFGVTVAPDFDPRFRDPDGDGIPEKFDKCPNAAEDLDGVEDSDGCPDPDNDGDGVEDRADKCPNEAEDRDGFQDGDGCPDPDNDGDGIVDVRDRCPNDAETKNGYMDEDGCADLKPIGDTDKDGISDAVDQCPFKEEDLDGFEDNDGCPDPDNDNDGVPDYLDQCANAREVYNQVDDEDGCPDESDRVRIRQNRIEISQKIFFEFNKSDIRKESDGLLSEIASLILAHPELKRIRIVGHTDDVGGPAFNLKLSQERADMVRATLIMKEVEGDRLVSEGVGETQPLVSGKSESAREKNRRVEFIIEYK